MTRDDQPTLAVPSDDRESAEQLSMFALRGQLALPGASAQLGLDRVAYATPATQERDPLDSDRSPERASPSLGSYTEFRTPGDLPPTDAPLPGQLPLALDLKAIDKAPQLSLFARQAIVRQLYPRGSEYERDGKCNWTRYSKDTDVTVYRSELKRFTYANLIRCNQWQTCPACGPRKCRAAAALLTCCIEAHLRGWSAHPTVHQTDRDTDVWMAVLTIPHYRDVPTERVVDQLYAAWDLWLHSAEWRAFARRWQVEAHVRILDNTQGGADGAHPHFNVLLFPSAAGLPTEHAWMLGQWNAKGDDSFTVDASGAETKEGVRVVPTSLKQARDDFGPWVRLSSMTKDVRKKFLDEIRGGLVNAWERCLRAVGTRIDDAKEFRERGLKLYPAERAASYVVKWGLGDEMAATHAKRHSHLKLIDAIAANVRGAAYVFKLWRRSTAGHALITGLKRACKKLGVTDDDAQAYLDEQQRRREREAEREGKPIEKVPELRLVIRSHVYAAAQALGFDAVNAFINETADRGRGEAPDWVQRELDGFLWQNMHLARNSDTS